MGLNFLDHPPRVPRNVFVEPEPQAAVEAPAAAKPVGSSAVATVLFRTLKQFPEAYRAVVTALRELSPDLAPA
jgi:hypothetical protein